MRKLCSAPLALLFVAAATLAGCEASPAASATTSKTDTSVADSGGGQDSAAADSTAVDTLVGDAGGKDATQDAVEDVQVADTEGDAAAVYDTVLTDTKITDAKTDSTSADAKADIAPSKCTSDGDCPKGFGDCIASKCDLTSGKCTFQIAQDGAACKTSGLCGGSGICKQGACAFKGACEPVNCAPEPLACGAKVVINPATLSPSGTSMWPCTGKTWDGGEKFFALASDATTTATVSLSADSTEAAALLLLGNYTAGSCSPKACTASALKQILGLPAGVQQILAVETKAGSSAVLTLTVTCAPKAKCGDGQCTEGESCGSCPKDCGTCAPCGDKTCDAAKENCASCPDDCGACPAPPPECVAKLSSDPSPTGCGGCACEECVFKLDSYCQSDAWDSICVGECSNECGGPVCGNPSYCGDKSCNGEEDEVTCPQDCGEPSGCGDGSCTALEKCSTCPGDCGPCTGASATAAVCGDGTCSSTEHCGVCPADCGVCSSECPTIGKTSSGPGCGGCSCEADVCKDDPYCCNSKWDGTCVSECLAVTKAKCPVDKCGDGVCSGAETCGSCKDDCGACVCGDGQCASSESTKTCPADCPAGCSTSDTPGCGGCACEQEVCAGDKFCCATAWDSYCVAECKATGKMTCK